MIIRLYHSPDEPKPVVLAAGLAAEQAGKRNRRTKYHQDPWSLAAHWRETWPVRDYLHRLTKHLRHLDDLTLELTDGTILAGDAAKDFIRRYA